MWKYFYRELQNSKILMIPLNCVVGLHLVTSSHTGSRLKAVEGKVKKPHHSFTEKEVASVTPYIAYSSSFTLNKNTLKHQVICGGFPNSNTETRKAEDHRTLKTLCPQKAKVLQSPGPPCDSVCHQCDTWPLPGRLLSSPIFDEDSCSLCNSRPLLFYEPLRMDGTPQQSPLYEVHLEKLTNF